MITPTAATLKDRKKGKSMRVVVIRDLNEKEVNIYGYGEYLGQQPCPRLSGKNAPKIILENGELIWGLCCWWDNPEHFENTILRNRRINIVPTGSPLAKIG